MNSIRATALAAVCTALCPVSAFAADPVIYQSASLVDFTVSGEPGDYYIDNTRSIGAAFQVTQAVDVTAIGGYFTHYSDGEIFGAIVPLASLTSLPTTAVDGNALGHVVFAADGSDQSAALTLQLAPGCYGIVFGSGLFGATGSSGLVSSQLSSGNNTFSGAGSNWAAWGDSDTRMVVYGSAAAVPEPATLALMLTGLAGCALLRKRTGR
jgi:hypothetical protein